MFKTLCLVLVLLNIFWITCAFAGDPPAAVDAQLLETGKRIYRDGILTSGQALEGLAIGEITLKGAQAACINCHLRSGLGASEAGQQVLPITGMALYQPGPPSFWYQHQIDKPDVNRFRPAYSDITLATALRSGITPTQRSLQRSMPRFNLSDADLKALFVYLKSLSDPSPAVDETTIHWATVVTPDTDPVERKALLDLMEIFFNERNADTNRYRHNGHIPPNHGYAPLLNWELHVWELQGAPETWKTQLEAYFHTRPVFAVLSGIGPGDWQPIHNFCESFEVACLFPNTFLPTIHEGDFYSLYFSKGLTLEAQVLAEFLSADKAHQNDHIIQVYRKEPQGKVPAAAFRKSMESSKSIILDDREIDLKEKMDSTFWQKLMKAEQPDTLILWLDDQDLVSLKPSGGIPKAIYVSGHLLKAQTPESLRSVQTSVFVVSPWGSIKSFEERFARMQSWMETKGVAVTDKQLQGNLLWLFWLVDNAVEQITHYFSPAYLIERIEDMMVNLTNSSLYPHLSLGPGQRFAAKGGYILHAEPDGELKPLGNYIVPNSPK
jgi:hypothetical protein